MILNSIMKAYKIICLPYSTIVKLSIFQDVNNSNYYSIQTRTDSEFLFSEGKFFFVTPKFEKKLSKFNSTYEKMINFKFKFNSTS